MIAEDVAALTQKFFTLFDANDVNVLVENQPTSGIDETRLWMRFTISPGFGKQSTMGATGRYTQLGVATLQVFAPEGTGTYAAFAAQDKFLNAMRTWRSTDKKLKVYKTSSDKTPQDGYTQFNVNIFWESQR